MEKNKLKMNLQMFAKGGDDNPGDDDTGGGTDEGSDETIETTQAEIDKIVEERVARQVAKTKELQSKLDKSQELIDSLETGDNSDEANELKEQLATYKGQIEELNSQHALDRKNSAIQLELTKANAKNFKAVQALIDMDKIEEQDDGTFEGLTEAVEQLVKDEPYLFEGEDERTQQQGDITIGGNPNRNNRNKKSDVFADAVKKFI